MKRDPYRYFRVEARDLVEHMSRELLSLEKSASETAIARLLRHAHTLKGAARVVKHREIADRSHAIEGLLAPSRESGSVAPEAFRALFGILDEIASEVAALPPPPGTTAAPAPDVLPTVRTPVSELETVLDDVTEAGAQIVALRESVDETVNMRHLLELLIEQLRPTGRERSIAEELRTRLVATGRNLTRGLERLAQELDQIREGTERLKLVPLGALFTTLERTARDSAEELGRSVAFEARGAEVRVDGHVHESVQGALVQLVRNAVAHGIEPQPERLAANKPPHGRIAVEAVLRGRKVVFRCHDDGRGIDLEAVRRAARLPAGTSSDEVLSLLLKGGISTAASVTEHAGRGIGLDIVRAAAERLGGEVSVRTLPGQSTTVELSVSVSASMLEGLLVEAAGSTALIPVEAVRSTIRSQPGQISHSPDGESLLHDGEVLPFAWLAPMLNRRASSSGGRSVVIIRSARGDAALGVDRLKGITRTLLRPLPALAPADPVVAGATLDANGNPRLVLDPEGLVAATRQARVQPGPTPATPRPVLIIDDSLTTRMLEQSILRSAGYEVELASSAEEGLDMARNKAYGLFLVDVEMPGMDGFEFIAQIHREQGLRDIPAVLVTSRDSGEDLRRGEEVGAQGYVLKSQFDQNELIDLIRRLAR